jgi:hypothetical protein
MQAGRHPLLWGLVGTFLMMAIFLLAASLVTALLTGQEGATDADVRIAVATIDGVISNDLTERTAR